MGVSVTLVDYPSQIKNGPSANVKSFGAKCDGTTDDSAAFNSAGASAYQNIFIPPGTCVASAVTPGAGQTWNGSGGSTLKLKANSVAASAVPLFKITNSNVTITNITFDLNSANVLQNTTPNNLWLQPTAASCFSTGAGITGFNFTGNVVTDGLYYGVDISGCQNSIVSGNLMTGLNNGGVQSTANPVNGNNINSGLVISNNVIKNILQTGGTIVGKGIEMTGTVGFTITGNLIQAFGDGVSNDGTRETMGVEVYGQNAGMVGGLPTFPIHGTISGNTINAMWALSIAGIQDLAITGNTIYCSSNDNRSNMSFTLTGGGGCVLGVEIVASQYVTVKGNNISARSSAPGVGISIDANCSTCFVNYSDHILIEDNQLSGHVAEINMDTGLSAENSGGVLAGCLLNDLSNYTNSNGLIQIRHNELTDYRYVAVVGRSAVVLQIEDNYISSAQGNYGSCGTTSGVFLGPQIGMVTVSGNEIHAQNVAVGDINTGGSVTGNPNILYLLHNLLVGGYVGLINSNGAAYHIESNLFILAPGNVFAIEEVTNDPSVPIWGLNNTFEGGIMAQTTATGSSSSTSLSLASGTGTANGEYLRCAGVAPGAGVASGGGTTSITLTLPTTAALSSTPCTFYFPWTAAFSVTAVHAEGSVVLSGNNIPVQTALNGGSLANFTTYGPVCGPFSYANIPPNQSILGQHCLIADSMTNTWGTTISGGGGDLVEGVFDGSNWTVVAK